MTDSRSNSFMKLFILLTLSIALLSGVAFAQGGATLTGTVTDPTGAVVANAKITITNVDNGFVREAESNSVGLYVAPGLGNGRYTMKVEASGFKSYTKTGIALVIGETVKADAVLQVGAQIEKITVEANAVQVQSETNEVSSTVTDAQVSQLATNGRNVLQLTALVPGAASQMPDFDTPVAQYQNRSINFNGQRSDHNQWLIDGGEAYDRGGGGILIVNPSQDAIQEFKVTTSNYDAGLGNASGGMITMAMKQGTTKYHGSGWEYVRNDWFNSFSWNSKNRGDPQNATKNVLRYNAYGFNFGGPINPKASNPKTFFFYNMEWRKRRQGNTSNNRALTAAQMNGTTPCVANPAVNCFDFTNLRGIDPATSLPRDFNMPHALVASEVTRWAAAGLTWAADAPFPNNQIPTSLANANALAFLATGDFPLANSTNSSGQPAYITDASQRDISREEAVRIDHQFNQKWTIMGHMIYDHGMQHLATPLWQGMTYPTVGTDAKNPAWSGVVRLTTSISPTLLNEVTFNTNGNNLVIDPALNGGTYTIPAGWTATQFFPAVNTINKLPSLNVTAGSSGAFGMNYDIGRWPWNNTWRSYEIKDGVSWSHGAHNVRFGGGYLWNHKMQFAADNVGGGYQFGGATTIGYADFLLGYASSYSQAQVHDAVEISAKSINIYGIDDWKVNNRLTLNLGLRWEGLPPAYDVNNRLSNFYPELYVAPTVAQTAALWTSAQYNSLNPLGGFGFTTVSGVPLSTVPFYMNGIGIAGRNGIPKGMFNSYWKTFAPRVGFAYSLSDSGKTVLRGGVGLFYERTAGNEQYNMMSIVPFTYTPSVGRVFLSNPNVSYVDGSSSASSYPVASISFGALRVHKVPTTVQWNFGIQHDMNGKAVLSVAYVGNMGYHLTDTIDINHLAINNTAARLAVCSSSNCAGGGSAPANQYRPYQGWGNLNMVENAANAHYHSLQTSLRTNSWHNMSFNAMWTYAHGFDMVDGELWNNLDNPIDKGYNYGTSGFDRRHVVNLTYVYTAPFFKKSENKVARAVLGGWTLSGVTTFSSGTPVTINNGIDNLGYGGGTTNHAQQVARVVYPKTKNAWFNGAAAFRRLNANTAGNPLTDNLAWGNSPRNSVKGPGRNNWNIALFKNFQVTERVGFELRAESFNTFNMTQYTAINTNIGDASNFGKVTGAADPRVFQLGGRISF